MKIQLPMRVRQNPVDDCEAFFEIGSFITLRVQTNKFDGRPCSAKVYHNDVCVARAVNKNEYGDHWWVVDEVKGAGSNNLWKALSLAFAVRGIRALEQDR